MLKHRFMFKRAGLDGLRSRPWASIPARPPCSRAGVVKWDTPVVKHLSWFVLGDDWITQHVTIADMYAHRSGLPDHAGDDLEDLGYDRGQVLERLRFLPLHSFRGDYAYTNFGVTAAAESVAAAAGADWASLSEEAIYRPLEMTSTSSRFSDFERQPNS